MVEETDFDVLIIGGGLSGVGAGVHLQKRCPDRSYAILEAREQVGGTWDLFRYPGIRSDSDMYTFGYAFEPWTDGKAFADGDAIRNYVRDTAERYGVDEHIRFGHRAVHARWDSGRALWTVEVERGTSAERAVFTAKFLIMCSGYYRYDRGYLPEFAGYDDFEGEIVHPQHWPEDFDYAGKKVIVIGSGATAVTLVPAMAEAAGHVTMLQRSPSYIASRPGRDAIANGLRRILPSRVAYAITRTKNILLAMWFFQLARRRPQTVRRMVMRHVQKQLGPDFDVETHFAPHYNPWDQRFCLAPDGDFFEALKSGKASVVTDHIERFTPRGVKLKSGEELEADVIVPATGLDVQLMGGMTLAVDEQPFDPAAAYIYRGMMLSGAPNLAFGFGYTNASWTLKIDLTFERVCRLLNYMQAHGFDACTPVAPGDLTPSDFLDFSSGYVRRAVSRLPKQGDRSPWRVHQNYFLDMLTIRYGKLDDGAVRFTHAGEAVGADTPEFIPAEAAE
ncbi:MAG: NAD(P)/FAD-dependent oxidoreductase [Maricaulaceae bacterium]|jgi:cation diffusion facilitator CzcD-associated flavoprotein CzcO